MYATEQKGFVLEIFYHSNPRTYFFNRCEKMGWDVLFGTEATIWQGVAQDSLWTELPMHQFRLEEAKQVLANAIEMQRRFENKKDVM